MWFDCFSDEDAWFWETEPEETGDSSGLALEGDMSGLVGLVTGSFVREPAMAEREGGRERERKERSARTEELRFMASGADIRRSTGILLEGTTE